MIRNSILALLLFVVCAPLSSAQAADSMWDEAVKMKDEAIGSKNYVQFLDAIKLMEKAYNQDKSRGDRCYGIGACYYYITPFGNNGKWIRYDEKAGLEWFKKGYELGDLRCALVLYKYYLNEYKLMSPLVPKEEDADKYKKEEDKIMKYVAVALRAPIPDDFDDYLTLGKAAHFARNYDLANQFYAKAADRGEIGADEYVIIREKALEYLTTPKAMYDAGIQMWRRADEEYGHHDKANGLRMFEKSAKLNYPPAQQQMGSIYFKGSVVEADTLKAVSWYKLAAQNGQKDVMLPLGRLYLNGKGVERDEDEAFKYLKMSADNGDLTAVYILGFCYLYGIGTPQDTSNARTNFQSVFDKVSQGSKSRLHHSNGLIIDLDYLMGLTYYMDNSPEAVTLFNNSLKNNTFYHHQRADLLYKLAACYREGKCGVAVDAAKADELTAQAREFGSQEINKDNFSY